MSRACRAELQNLTSGSPCILSVFLAGTTLGGGPEAAHCVFVLSGDTSSQMCWSGSVTIDVGLQQPAGERSRCVKNVFPTSFKPGMD